MKSRPLLAVVLACYIAAMVKLLAICQLRKSISMKYGPAWEFWYAWSNLGLMFGLLEVCLLFFLPGERSLSIYAKGMVMAHIPLLSERVDTAKDVVFVFVADAQDEELIAIAAMSLLVVGHAYSACNKDVCAELVESYLPILSSEPKQASPDEPAASTQLALCCPATGHDEAAASTPAASLCEKAASLWEKAASRCKEAAEEAMSRCSAVYLRDKAKDEIAPLILK